MTRYGRPARGVEVPLAIWETRFEDRGIHGGDTLWADPDQLPDESDLVLVDVNGRYKVCPFAERGEVGVVVGPIVLVQRPAVEPAPSRWENVPIEQPPKDD